MPFWLGVQLVHIDLMYMYICISYLPQGHNEKIKHGEEGIGAALADLKGIVQPEQQRSTQNKTVGPSRGGTCHLCGTRANNKSRNGNVHWLKYQLWDLPSYHVAMLRPLWCYNSSNSAVLCSHVTWATGWTLRDKCFDNVSCFSVAWVRPGLLMTVNYVISKHSLDCMHVHPDSVWWPPLLDRITSIMG